METLDGLSAGATSDGERLWKLAHRIEAKQLWAGYLSEQEHAIWRKALRSRDYWDAFLEGHGEGIDPVEAQVTETQANGATKNGDNGEKVADPVTTAFRARVMLYEASVRKLFPTRLNDDFMDFVIDDITDNVENQPTPAIEEKPKTREIEEDNYDDEEDEEQSSEALVQINGSSTLDGDTSLDNLGTSPNDTVLIFR
jgi:hypothetical protein